MAVTTSVIKGNLLLQSLDGNTILCTTNAVLTITNEEIETTCKDNDGAYTSTNGAQKWTAQIDGNVVFDNAYGIKDLNVLTKTADTTTMLFGTDNPDDPAWTGAAFISSYTLNAPLNAPATFSITLSPRGPIYLLNS